MNKEEGAMEPKEKEPTEQEKQDSAEPKENEPTEQEKQDSAEPKENEPIEQEKQDSMEPKEKESIEQEKQDSVESKKETEPSTEALEANFSILILSIASSAAISLGLTPDPSTGKTSVNKKTAQFNIDLLEVLKEKTENNRSAEEDKLLHQLISDLKLKFVSS